MHGLKTWQNLFHMSFALRVAHLGIREVNKWWFVLTGGKGGLKGIGENGQNRTVIYVGLFEELAGYPGGKCSAGIWDDGVGPWIRCISGDATDVRVTYPNDSWSTGKEWITGEFRALGYTTPIPDNALVFYSLKLCSRANHSHQLL